MIDFAEVSTALGTVVSMFTALGGFGIWQYKKQNKRLKESEAKLSEINVQTANLNFEKERVNHLHEIIENYNKTEIEHSQRISDLNHALNVKEDELREKTVQIRNLTEKLYTSEQEVNRVQDLLNDSKDRITKLTEERDEERRLKEYYKRWRCEKSTCKDPDGRIPPNSKLSAEIYTHPE